MNIQLGPVFEYVDAFLLVFVRMTGLFVAAPIFSRRNIPNHAKIGIAFLTTVLIADKIKRPDLLEYRTVLQFGLLVTKEFLVGITIGFAAYLVFSAVYVAGQVIDMQIGFGMVNVIDPMSNIQVPITSNFYFILSMLLFLTLNGHHLLIRALYDSFGVVPLGGAVFGSNLTNEIVSMFVGMFVLGFKISAPIIAATLITEVALGVMARTIPQLNVFVVGLPVRIIIGLIVMMITVPVLVGAIQSIVTGMKENIYELIRNMVNTG